jgi:uncharacterized membrane protein YphA (DoxX/SURF4 family)
MSAQDISYTPSFVSTVLGWRWIGVSARIALTGAYIFGGIVKLSNFPAAIAEQEHLGLHPGWVWAAASIIVELGGSALVISGRLVWLGAGALGVLTAIATLVANNFWTMQGHARFVATNSFAEHIGLIAGFVLIAIVGQRPARESSKNLP